MKKNYFLFSSMMLVMLFFMAFTNNAKAQLYVNEFLASNDASFPGPQGDFPDWIEIYNAGVDDVMLGGYYLFDTYDLAEAIQIPSTYPDSVTVPAGGFLVFYANKGEASSVMNLNFKLSGSGEQIGFWAPDQTVIDSLTYGAQEADISYGRYADGTNTWFLMTEPTPGTANIYNPGPVEVELYINEFMASNDASFPGPQGDFPDWIEIYNAGSEAVMLGGYYLFDVFDLAEAIQIPSTYPDSVTVPAGGFLVFYANKGEASSVMNLNFKLSGSGEQIGFWNPAQEIIDSLSYGAQEADISFGRYADGANTWFLMTEPTPGAANIYSPGPVEVELYINEFMASNDFAFPGPQGDYPDWIEIYNAGSEDVNLGGYYMYDALDVNEAYMIPVTYSDSVTVAAGGFIVFYANGNPETSVMNLDFKLGGGGEQIGLWNMDQAVVDTLTYTAQMADTSYGRYADGSENWFLMNEFTPGATNIYNPGPTEVELYINEFLASNDSSFPGPQGDFPDWIEIYNAGSDDVMLGGYYLFDVFDLTDAIQIPSTYPDSVTVPAGGFLVFYANKADSSSVMNLNFKLSGGGEQIGFWNPDQTVIDSLTYGAQETDISFGRYADGTNTWFLMTEPTPGAANIYNPGPVEVELYINEFLASNDSSFHGPQSDFPDWIEIYNAGTEAVNLSGYYMYDTLDVNEAYQISATYPDSVTVPAGGFIVFYANGNPESSVRNLDFKLSGGGEQIGFWNPAQEIIDSLSYGAQEADISYGRYADGTNTWFLMTEPTPGTANVYNPGPAEVELYINEFMASNDFAFPGPQGDHPDWIEIYNAGSEAVMLGGYYMYDALDVTTAYQISATYPDSVTVAAGGFIVFYANGNPESSVMNLDFKLGGGGEQIGFWAPDMAVIDTLSYTEQVTDTSYGRYPDGSAEWFMMPNYTPGAANQPVGINEINNNISNLGNSPNPFSNETNIGFTLKNSDNVVIRLYDARGALIKVLADGNFQTGTHSVNWSAANMKAGYYFYTLQTSTNILSRKALIVK